MVKVSGSVGSIRSLSQVKTYKTAEGVKAIHACGSVYIANNGRVVKKV